MTSERLRHREVNRYYQTWLESSSGFDHGEIPTTARRHADGSVLRPSKDKSLIAFAQLGCLRLNAKRGIVTLISSERQYILAEATKSLSLKSGLPENGEDDELWFGNASIPRSQGISGSALDPPQYDTIDSEGRQHSGRALVIDDITQDDRYKDHAFAGRGVNFYCGVPITSKAGHHIGVYTITDNKPRRGLSPSQLGFMLDMADTVMRHLETVYGDAARHRGEQLVTGLGRFLGGMTSMSDSEEAKDTVIPRDESSEKDDHSAASHSESLRNHPDDMSITNADPTLLREVRSSLNDSWLQASSHSRDRDTSPSLDADKLHDSRITRRNSNSLVQSPVKTRSDLVGDDRALNEMKVQKLFGRAANILRQCTDADGAIFYDATSTNLTRRCGTSEFDNNNDYSDDNRTTTDGRTMSDTSNAHGYSSGSTDSEVSDRGSRILTSSGKNCGMLGYSLDISASSTAAVTTIQSLGLTERSLRRLIKRYPRGKVFYFTEKGDVSASETETAERSEEGNGPSSNAEQIIGSTSRRTSGKPVASELIRAMPGARNIIWLPLWDFTKQRWCAGTFLWSRRPDRLLAAQDDLTYLKTFGNSIMMNVARLDAQSADQAKSTFIANISHELRSPLHGVLGSLEFLQETSLDGFQSSMTHAVETCARTLLDTVEHILDYAKINQMAKQSPRKKRGKLGTRGHEIDAITQNSHSRSITSDLDLAGLLEEAVEAVYAGQTFRRPAGQHLDGVVGGVAFSPNQPEEVLRSNIEQGSNKFAGAVRLVLEIGTSRNWWVRTQPGAIKRIVMNILGNSLKYTDKGRILVSMKSHIPENSTPSYNVVCITVKDTGRGMSPDFLRNHAFTPFSQESSLSIGTGLGLSIVRQIVNALDGRMELDSEKDVGTETRIFLTFPSVPAPSPSGNIYDRVQMVRQQTSGMSLCILDPKADEVEPAHHNDTSHMPVDLAIRKLAENWFGMRTCKSKSLASQSADFFVYAEPPPISFLLRHHGHTLGAKEVPLIIMVTNAFESASLVANGINQLTDLGRILEIISQPCGPQKLAKALHRCLTRRASLQHCPENASKNEPIEPKVADKPGTSLKSKAPTNFSIQHLDALDPSQEKAKSLPAQHSRPTEQVSIDMLPTDGFSGPRKDGILQKKSSESLGTISINHSLQKQTPVLLVEDNDINLRLLIAFMKKIKLPYTTAKDGLQATQAYEQSLKSDEEDSRFRYVVMDISMPVMDGIEATRIIRQQEKRFKIAEGALIIALSGLGAASTRQEMFAAGADYYLTKPVKFKELINYFQTG